MADEKKPAENKGLTREMFKKIKHLDMKSMDRYIRNVFGAGFDAGYKAAQEAARKGEEP